MSQLRKKFLIELGIALGGILVLGGGVFFFSASIKTFAENLHKKNRELQLRSSSIGRLAELERLEREVGAPYLNVLYNFIPKKDELINFSREVRSLADSEGLQFGFSFLGENPASETSLGSVRFALNLSGRSDVNIYNFIKKLQEFRFLTKIEDFSINGIEGARATIHGQVYFRK